MKLYNSLGPNPRLVRMFMLEKDLKLPVQEVDIVGGENRRPPYTDANPAGQMPALELDDGRVISETVAICEYLEDVDPEPRLIGASPEERAETRMWVWRIELNIVEPMANGFRYSEGLAMFKDRIHTIPHAADDLKTLAQKGLGWIDGLMRGREFVAGSRFTLADIVLYCFLDFGTGVGQPLDPSQAEVGAWFERIAARPSASGSLHPAAVAGGMRA